MSDKLPNVVFYVFTDKLESEKKYYGPKRANRLYTSLAYAKQFITANSRRQTRVYKGHVVEWEEVTDGI